MLANTDKPPLSNSQSDENDGDNKQEKSESSFNDTRISRSDGDSNHATQSTNSCKTQTSQASNIVPQPLSSLTLALSNQSELLPIAEEKDSPSGSSSK